MLKIYIIGLEINLRNNGAHIDEIFMHPLMNQNKIYQKRRTFKKPNTGMINKANEKWNIDMKKSYIIGDYRC